VLRDMLRVLNLSVKAPSLIEEIRDEICGPFLPIATCDFRPTLALNSHASFPTLAVHCYRPPYNLRYSATTCQDRTIAQTTLTFTQNTSASPFLLIAT
jgi:hypothetical protein